MVPLGSQTLFDNPLKKHSYFVGKIEHQAWPTNHREVAS
jgi:hypothetical protein